MNEFEPEIETLTLIPARGGLFEVAVNGSLIFSKQAARRHARSGEIAGLIRSFLQERAV